MDLTRLSIDELKTLRDNYEDEVAILKEEIQIIRAAIDDPRCEMAIEVEDILKNRLTETRKKSNAIGDDVMTEEEYLKAVTQIKTIDVSMKRIRNGGDGDTDLYLYTCKGKFDKLHFEIEYESNLSPQDDPASPMEENLTKLNVKILRPSLQAKLQKGINFLQESPNCLSSAIVFLKSVYDLIEVRTVLIKKIHEYGAKICIGVSRSTDQHSLMFKSEFDNEDFLHIKWNFKWDMRTGLVNDLFTAKIIRADDQLMGELKPLVEKLCSDKFSLDSSPTDKANLFRSITTAIKDADTRANNSVLP